MKFMFQTLFKLLISIPTTIFGGFIFAHMWNWFVLRKFSGAPELGTADGIGLMMAFTFPLFGIHLMNLKKEMKGSSPGKSDFVIDIALNVIVLFFLYPCILGLAFLWHKVIS